MVSDVKLHGDSVIVQGDSVVEGNMLVEGKIRIRDTNLEDSWQPHRRTALAHGRQHTLVLNEGTSFEGGVSVESDVNIIGGARGIMSPDHVHTGKFHRHVLTVRENAIEFKDQEAWGLGRWSDVSALPALSALSYTDGGLNIIGPEFRVGPVATGGLVAVTKLGRYVVRVGADGILFKYQEVLPVISGAEWSDTKAPVDVIKKIDELEARIVALENK